MKNSTFNANDRIDTSLLDSSICFLTGDIDNESILPVLKWITYENLDIKQQKTLTLYINSNGGDLYQAFALIDAMRQSHHPIRTVGLGGVMSAAFLIFVSGTKGERYAGKHTSFMCHQFSDSSEGKYHDIRAAAKESESLNQRMLEILKEATGLSAAAIRKQLLPPSDVYLSATEMLDISAADHIL